MSTSIAVAGPQLSAPLPVGGSPAIRGLTLEHLECQLDVSYNWGYESTRKDLRDLYTKAKRNQWIPEDILPWDAPVDPERPALPEVLHPLFGSEILGRLTERERARMNAEMTSWILSNFLHGEQGALLAASQLVVSVPMMDGKYYASTQVVDEGRHVEVFDRYLHEKVGFSYPINPDLKRLLDLILKDSRWDMKLLGMQIMVEGLALAAFGLIRDFVDEPLLKALTTYVMRDEARHVAFGILSLKDLYADFTEADRREREDFIYEASVLMRDRFLFQQVYQRMGLPVEECVQITLHSEPSRVFRQLLFSKIVPAIKKMGLLSDRQRQRFEDLGILQYEHLPDASEEDADAMVASSPLVG